MKGEDPMKLTGKILHLSTEPSLLRAQLDGQSPELGGSEYHFAVNTDAMISGRACTLATPRRFLGRGSW